VVRPLRLTAFPKDFSRGIRGILHDFDDTVTDHGKFPAASLQRLEHIRKQKLQLALITGRPAGWVDFLARMLPFQGVVGENGGFYAVMEKKGLRFHYVQSAAQRAKNKIQLEKIARKVLRMVPGSQPAVDNPYRQCDIAIDFAEDTRRLPLTKVNQIAEIFRHEGAQAKISSIHVNAWFGDYDKLTTTQLLFQNVFGVDLRKQEKDYLFLGDSPNDEPMFRHFSYSIACANIRPFLKTLAFPPRWITQKPGAQGFAEAIDLLLGPPSKTR